MQKIKRLFRILHMLKDNEYKSSGSFCLHILYIYSIILIESQAFELKINIVFINVFQTRDKTLFLLTLKFYRRYTLFEIINILYFEFLFFFNSIFF